MHHDMSAPHGDILLHMSSVHRGAVMASHLSPRVTHAVWTLCWALSLFQRTSTHPPLAMLQPLQIPSHDDSTQGPAAVRNKDAAEAVGLSLVIVAVEHRVLCLGLWPRHLPAAADACNDLEGKDYMALHE